MIGEKVITAFPLPPHLCKGKMYILFSNVKSISYKFQAWISISSAFPKVFLGSWIKPKCYHLHYNSHLLCPLSQCYLLFCVGECVGPCISVQLERSFLIHPQSQGHTIFSPDPHSSMFLLTSAKAIRGTQLPVQKRNMPLPDAASDSPWYFTR